MASSSLFPPLGENGMKYVCSHCHCEESVTTRHAKCACGGLWQLDYRPPAFTADGIDRAE